ncbi:hypothetical protein T552_00111 [Pneumocystis carinii B80]|uniref:EXS domain-containing protein n=1 Tax=Pneumocystis carinii (strain B80) TaxID=1408658 RepID=A0A0W4ZSV7_PNEC8|nr:hypothetical protein T552_00111 [Pneumocystis carinii B80]KTW31469.1 hypothetical protein T552_00111 [Pneumocystis carinii B80]
MKYAKKLEKDLISEWSEKYVNYKKAKKLVTRIAKKKDLGKADYEHSHEKQFTDNSLENQNLNAFLNNNINYDNSNNNFLKKITDPTELVLEVDPEADIINKEKSDENNKEISQDSLSQKLSANVSDLTNTSCFSNSYTQYIPSYKKTPLNDINSELYSKSLNNNYEISQFFIFLNKELRKVDNFYREKEKKAELRLQQIKEQLYEMDNRHKNKIHINSKKKYSLLNWENSFITPLHKIVTLFKLKKKCDVDYQEYQVSESITYKAAKKRLKTAIIDFYHEAELLKSYRIMNIEAFRKALKKITKITGTNYLKFYMPKVTKSHFGSSKINDNLITEAEDVFAYYFEKNDRKNAIKKLRTKQKTTVYIFFYLNITTNNKKDHSSSLLCAGLYLGISLPLFIEGLVYANKTLINDFSLTVIYLIEIWNVFFLILLFLLLFGLNCYIWTKSKINYAFIFEFDTSHNLNWKQYLEIPSVIFLLFSLFFWLTFKNLWQPFVNYYPLFFIIITTIILLNPLPYFYRESRKWFIISNLRLFFSGLCSVEFRDFFMGDQYNSLVYLFFCFYNYHFKNLIQCDISHFKLMGFLQTIPGIFRFLQCLRRYYDSRHVFPHLINAGKYACAVLTYTFFSIWKINSHSKWKIIYITFASINSIYTSFWDLFIDFSLMQLYAERPLLRNNLIFKHYWVYYLIIVFDPILRFSWVLYFIFIKNIQYLHLITFIIAVIEVFRRFLWNIFRVENEHSTNVLYFRVSRNIPLPYTFSTLENKDQEIVVENNIGSKKKYSKRPFFNNIAISLFQLKHREDFTHRKPNYLNNKKNLNEINNDRNIFTFLNGLKNKRYSS